MSTLSHWSWVKLKKYAVGPVIRNVAQNIIQTTQVVGAVKTKKRPYRANNAIKWYRLANAESMPLNIERSRTLITTKTISNTFDCDLLIDVNTKTGTFIISIHAVKLMLFLSYHRVNLGPIDISHR